MHNFSVKRKFVSSLETIHQKFFGHELSDEMRIFLTNFSWSLLGGILASVILFVVNILAGRWLGPELYGGYNSILSLSGVLAGFFLLGFDVSGVRYLSDEKFKDVFREIFTTVLLSVLLIIGFTISIILIFHDLLINNLSISSQFLILGVVLALVLALKSLFNGFLRAFSKHKLQSIMRFLDALLVFIVFIILIVIYKKISVSSYIYAISLGGLFFIMVACFALRKYFLNFDYSILKKIFFEYNRFLLFASIIGIIIASDRFIIGKVLGLQELGYYSAYYVASNLVVAEMGGIFMNAFWPSAIKNIKSIKEIIRKIEHIFVFYAPFWIILIALNTTIFFSFFGRDYPMRLDYIAFFSINSFLGFMLSIYLSLLSVNYIKKSVVMSALFAVISVGSLILFKNIAIYLMAQIILHVILIYQAREILRK